MLIAPPESPVAHIAQRRKQLSVAHSLRDTARVVRVCTGLEELVPSARLNRRLVAVLMADVVGYSRMMSENEAGTIASLKKLRRTAVQPELDRFGGNVLKLMGDGMLAEFPSVVDAVDCAISIQRNIADRNREVPDQQAIALRIGINLGDIVVERDDIYGDGINVASRLEGLADPGGIVISGFVYEQVKGKLDAGFEDIGLQTVKNIGMPIRAYRVAQISVSAEPSPNLPLPEKPSIAVLPFDNMSADQEQQYFADGIAEDLTTALSHFDWMFVAARNSAFTYKGKAVDVKQVGRELGVRYVVEGSVRKIGRRVRINVQLIDTETHRHVWADRLDRELEDVFEVQDDIVSRIAAIVGPEITSAEIERTSRKRAETLDAWDHYLRALALYHRMTKEDMQAAIGHLESAFARDQGFARAHALMGLALAQIGGRGWRRPARAAFEAAFEHADRAVRLAPTSPEANHALAFVLGVTGRAHEAITVARRAIDLNPSLADAYAVLGHNLIFCGNLEEGLDACLMAERRNPRDTRGSWLYDAMGHAYFFLGEYDRAIEVSRKGLHQDPSLFGALVTLACVHAELGNETAAQHHVNQLLAAIPRYSLRALRKNPMFVDPDLVQRLVASMAKAGLPE